MTEPPASQIAKSEQDLLATLFDLGRQITSVLDLDDLLRQIPQLIARLIHFQAFAVYLLDSRKGELRVAYSVGYPEGQDGPLRLKVGEGLVGAAVAEKHPILVNDVSTEPRYVEAVPGMASELVVPLIHQAKPIGALNVLSSSPGQFSESDLEVLRQFAAHVAVAIVNARMFERERAEGDAFETLAAIGREMSAVLDLDALLTRLAQLTKRLVSYRTFGILLLNEERGELEMKLALQYGESANVAPVKLGEGLVGYAALHKEPVLVSDVSKDSRYIKVLEDVRSELVVPMLVKDRCIGVFDLESPELDAFTKRDAEVLTLLASQAAVAVENARLYERIVANESRMEQELRFAQRVQAAFLPQGLPKKVKNLDIAARFAAARELGGDFHDFQLPESQALVVAVGDVSGKGVPAALYSVFAAELVRGRTFRRRYLPERSSPAAILSSVNTILHQRQLEEYYCTACYALFDLKRRIVTLSNSGLPYPVRCTADRCAEIELPGVPLGSFFGTTYEEITLPLNAGDLFVFCTDGIFEAFNAEGQEFGAQRLIDVVAQHRGSRADDIVDAIMNATRDFRGDYHQTDDQTAVAVRITG
ncbi:MAG TPA: GAF domain-containing SpoIIE family protein phosphatase [Vicinamibacterales bacterium]|nr:GAF domain-containing SpoIIE family protein phosphatase [Vicinamibacterales bacterium]